MSGLLKLVPGSGGITARVDLVRLGSVTACVPCGRVGGHSLSAWEATGVSPSKYIECGETPTPSVRRQVSQPQPKYREAGTGRSQPKYMEAG